METKKKITKSNHLIEASYKLSLLEARLILYITSMIKKDDDKFRLYRVKVSEFIEITNSKRKDIYKEIREATKRYPKVILFSWQDTLIVLQSSKLGTTQKGCVLFLPVSRQKNGHKCPPRFAAW